MPLLKKKKFCKIRSLDDFRANEEVFHCQITNEIFRDYDEFCTRVILCNSMVWTCGYTGKSGLTFSEAVESEKLAKKLFKDFPKDLRVPILFITSKTQRSSFHDVLEDVYSYVKDRYFIGESVEASFTGDRWRVANILQVMAPTAEKLKRVPKNGQAQYGPPATLYHYEVEQMDSEDPDLSEVMVVGYDQIRRRKKLGRDKLKLFLKQHVEQNELGVLIVKPVIMEKFGIHKVNFDQIFDGFLPRFNISKKKIKNDKNSKQATLVPFLKNKGDVATKVNKVNHTPNGLTENTNNLIEKMKKRHEEFKQKKEILKQQRAQERMKQKEENLKIAVMLKEWYKPKEDLELEDHKILPVPTPVHTQIPEQHMGDVFTILEFVNTFSKFLPINNFFPGGLTLEIMERGIIEKEVAGPLMDLIQMLVSSVLNVQLDEASQYNTKLDINSGIEGRDYNDNVSLTEASHFATLASNWSSTYQGIPLTNLPLFTLTTSEILRLHLLSSGARINDTGARWRYQYRGGYTSEDDPGLYFRLKYPHILKALASHCVTELPTADILRIIDCLMSQLLTYADVRDLIEDQQEKSRQAKLDYKATQIAERRQEQECTTAKFKVKKECKENNVDPTEQLDRLDKEAERKKRELETKLNNLMTLSNKHQTYLGQDRAFRKYLKLQSVPGIFVNFEEDNPGYCYEECIQQNCNLVNAGRSEIIAHLRKIQEQGNTSDKENALGVSTTDSNNLINGEISSNKPVTDPDELLICNSNPETCVVHSSTMPRKKWSYFTDPEQITELIKSLNARGVQEGELKQAIVNDEDYLMKVVENAGPILNPKPEVSEENKDDDSEHKTKNTRHKSKQKYENATLGYPKELPTTLILQFALVENILEMEEKIFAGNLGSIKVKNREIWRTSLANHDFNQFEKNLRKDCKVNNKYKEVDKNSRPNTPELIKEYKDPGIFLAPLVSFKNECSESTLLHSDEHKLAIHCLARALSQVAEGVDSRYLKKPLGNVNMRNDTNKSISDILDKWKSSLLASTSYCQIFLHYSSLDNCILWVRSALLARCMVCRKLRDFENMLVCDNCNKGMHLYCHRPKLTSVPKGDWFCIVCHAQKEAEEKLKNPTPKTRKRRRIFVEDESDQSDTLSQDQQIRKRVTRPRKRRILSTDGDESSEQSDININSRKTRSANTRKKIVPIIEEDDSTEKSDTEIEDSELHNKDESSAESEFVADTDEENSEDQEESELSENSEIEQNESEGNEAGGDESEGVETGGEESENEEAEYSEVENDESESEETNENKNESNEDQITDIQEDHNIEEIENIQIIDNIPNGDLSGDEANGDGPVEVCEKCGFGGTLLCCDNCPELYHLECANPPLRRVPRGEWYCHKCKSSKKKEDTDDDWYLSHSVAQCSGLLQNQRRCASRAKNSIYGFAKILRRISKYEDNSRRSVRRDDLPLNNAQLQEALTEVMKQEYAWPFLRPVNKTEVPDYYGIVANPMDFGTIKYKLNMGRYKFDSDLMTDVALVFENCKLYNNSQDEVYQCGLKMLTYFVDKCHELGLLVPSRLENREVLLEEDPLSIKQGDEKMQVD